MQTDEKRFGMVNHTPSQRKEDSRMNEGQYDSGDGCHDSVQGENDMMNGGVDPSIDVEIMASVPKHFSIRDEQSANWLVRKIMASRQYAAHVKTWAALEIKRSEREEYCLMFLYGRQIEQWARDELVRLGGRRRSLALPAGTVGFRKVNANLIIDNGDAVITWARKNCPSAIQVTERLAKTPINEHFASTGELPDGAHVEPERETFRIT